MKMLRTNFRNGTGGELRGLSVSLLIIAILVLFLNGCSVLSRNAKKDTIPTEPVIQTINGLEYFCLEKRAFTAILQEASRNCN